MPLPYEVEITQRSKVVRWFSKEGIQLLNCVDDLEEGYEKALVIKIRRMK